MSFDFIWTPDNGSASLNGYGLPANIDLASDPRRIIETLTTPGVDGARFRLVGRQYPMLEVTTVLVASSFQALLTLEDQVQRSQGIVGSLTLRFGGSTFRTWPKATMVAAVTQRSGRFVGPENADFSLRMTCEIMRQQEAEA